jgi:hypothetical protein
MSICHHPPNKLRGAPLLESRLVGCKPTGPAHQCPLNLNSQGPTQQQIPYHRGFIRPLHRL